MILNAFSIGTLAAFALVLSGCSKPRVSVTIQTGTEAQEHCLFAEHEGEIEDVRELTIGSGSTMRCRLGPVSTCEQYVCKEMGTVTVPVRQRLEMSAEEFNFRYQNDPEFKNTVTNYSFR